MSIIHTKESEVVWGMLVMDFERSPLSQRSLHERIKKTGRCIYQSGAYADIFMP